MMGRREMLMRLNSLEEATATGNPVTFSTTVAKPLVHSQIGMEPVQAGSGDPSPQNVRPITGWTGCKVTRTGKNLSEVATLKAGATIVLVDFGHDITVPKNGLIVSMYINGTVWSMTSGWLLDFQNSAGSHGHKSVSTCASVAGVTITANEPFTGQLDYKIGEITFRKIVLNSFNTQNGTVDFSNIQVELSGSASPYAPYSGETVEVTFPAVGKNLWHLARNGYYNSSGTFIESNSNGCSDKIPIAQGESIAFGAITRGSATVALRGYFFNADGGVVGSQIVGANSVTAVVPQGAVSVALWFAVTGYADTVTQAYCDSIGIQAEKASSLSSFEPYTNTVYGGTVDLATGTLTVTHGIKTLDGSETWSVGSFSNYRYQNNGMASVSVEEVGLYADKLKAVAFINRGSVTVPDIMVADNDYVEIRNMASLGVTDVPSLKTWLAGNNVVIVYPLATPITYHLTPQQITALIGDNVLWSDTNGTNTVTYLKKK